MILDKIKKYAKEYYLENPHLYYGIAKVACGCMMYKDIDTLTIETCFTTFLPFLYLYSTGMTEIIIHPIDTNLGKRNKADSLGPMPMEIELINDVIEKRREKKSLDSKLGEFNEKTYLMD